MIKVGSDFSGVGAFDQALIRLNIDYKTMFACDMDLYVPCVFFKLCKYTIIKENSSYTCQPNKDTKKTIHTSQ